MNKAREILESRSASYWLKNAVQTAGARDIVDALRDVEALHAALLEKFNETPQAECQNCDWSGPLHQVRVEIPHYNERVEPGEPEPCGECPDCGALCHTVDGDAS